MSPLKLPRPLPPSGDQPEAIEALVAGARSGSRFPALPGSPGARKELLERMVAIQYTRNDLEVGRGNFRVRGDVIEVHPAYEDHLVRIELDDEVVARLSEVDPLTGTVRRRMDRLALYPAKHFVTP